MFSYGNSAFWKQTEKKIEDLKAISNIGDFQIGKLKIFVSGPKEATVALASLSGPDKNYNYNKKERLQRLREYRVIIAIFAYLLTPVFFICILNFT